MWLQALSDDGDGCEALEPLVSAEWGSKNKTLVDALLMDAEPAAANPRAPEAKAMLEKDRRSVPPGNVATLTALFAWLLVTGMLKDVVACGSLAYWALTLSMVPLVAAVMAVVRRRLIGKQRLKVDVRPTRPAAVPPRLLRWHPHRTPRVAHFDPPQLSAGRCTVAGSHHVPHGTAARRWAWCPKQGTSAGRSAPRSRTPQRARARASSRACLASAAASSRARSCCTSASCPRWPPPRPPP